MTGSTDIGLNVAGLFRSEAGLGEAARHIISGLKAEEIPFSLITYTDIWSRQEHPFDENESDTRFDTNLICVNVDIFIRFVQWAGFEFFRDRYTIAFWWWEVSTFPSELRGAFEIVDEVWTGSEYSATALRTATAKPVTVIPLPIEIPDDGELMPRSELGLDDRFLFLFSFDYFSVFERKNPLAVIDAFSRAFQPDEGPVLLIKSINGAARPETMAKLEAAARGRRDIIIRDAYVSAREKNSLAAACDCYVSLHRSEGLGLTMAEAMGYGKPVVATGYSGNLTFMNDQNSYLIPYELGRVPEGCQPYPPGAEWAEPDIAKAAEAMRHVYTHPEEARVRGLRARDDIRSRHSARETGVAVRQRLSALANERRGESRRSSAEIVRGLVDAAAVPLADAKRRLEGPVPITTSGARLGSPAVLFRRILGRLLWPYTAEQYRLQRELSEALEAVRHSQAWLVEVVADLQRSLRDEDDARERRKEP